MRPLTIIPLLLAFPAAALAETVPAGGMPFCSTQKDMQQLLVKSLDKNWDPPGDLDCLFLKAGLEMRTIREIKGMSPAGRVTQIRVTVPGSGKTVEGYAFQARVP
jgi:hypothetical protein